MHGWTLGSDWGDILATPTKRKTQRNPLDRIVKTLAPRLREFRSSLHLFTGNVTAMAGLIMVLFIFFLAIAAPILMPAYKTADPLYIPKDFEDPKPPMAEGHPLGTGALGSDLLYGVIWGARTTVWVSLFVIFFAAIIGIAVGAIAGYFGGKIDEVIMRITDVFLSLPALVLAMAVTAVLGGSLEMIMVALIIVWWPPYARLVRSQVLTVRESTYVEAARAVGAKKSRILFRHIVPNSLSPMIVAITLDMGAVVLVTAALSFIGFGVQTGYAEYGKMVSDGQVWMFRTVVYEGTVYHGAWWAVTIPGLMILIYTMGFSLVGDALRDIMDPRLRR
jgi:peptide/nickel transport system permease protein